MKESFKYSILCFVMLAVGQYSAVSAEENASTSGEPLSRQETVLTTMTASVEAISLTNREVTLKGPLGNTVTFTVDQRVKRFDEIKVGDFVRADYYVSVAAELRKPTAQEREHPIEVLEGAGKAPPGTSPAAGGLRHIKVVTTVEGLDRPTQTITVKGPRGNYLTARVEHPENLTKMRIGDNIVVTYTEALAISLEKVDKKGSE